MADPGMLTLAELHAELGDLLASGVSPDSAVILAKDGEGNDYSPIAVDADAEGLRELSFSAGYWRAESRWGGQFWAPGDMGEDDFDDDPRTVGPNDVKAVVLWPTN